MLNDFEVLYDEIIDFCNKTQKYATEKLMTCSEEEKPLYRNFLEAVDNLHETAHEIEEHLAWD